MVHEVVENKEYAVVLSTCSGAWRYIIGDVVKFTSVKNSEIVIVGRTKQFLSLCGEHLSIDNMNKAIDEVQNPKYNHKRICCLAGFVHEGKLRIKWFIGCDENVDKEEILQKIRCYLIVRQMTIMPWKDWQLFLIYLSKFYLPKPLSTF
ncbi:MAG: GH3 auxin-responsive promoter family protein [Bacteroidetes bacterium]|nr:GH3 auxin-responsive promoter family protein [Bacteroidota bacterium]